MDHGVGGTGSTAVTVGVDTHLDKHVAVALDQFGRKLGTLSIPTSAAGYRQLLTWSRDLGTPTAFGIEGTGSYGAGSPDTCGCTAWTWSR